MAGIEWDLVEASYSRTDAERAIDLARSGRVVDTGSSAGMSAWMHAAGFGRQLRAAFGLGHEPDGVFLALRERRSRRIRRARRGLPPSDRAPRRAGVAAGGARGRSPSGARRRRRT